MYTFDDRHLRGSEGFVENIKTIMRHKKSAAPQNPAAHNFPVSTARGASPVPGGYTGSLSLPPPQTEIQRYKIILDNLRGQVRDFEKYIHDLEMAEKHNEFSKQAVEDSIKRTDAIKTEYERSMSRLEHKKNTQLEKVHAGLYAPPIPTTAVVGPNHFVNSLSNIANEISSIPAPVSASSQYGSAFIGQHDFPGSRTSMISNPFSSSSQSPAFLMGPDSISSGSAYGQPVGPIKSVDSYTRSSGAEQYKMGSNYPSMLSSGNTGTTSVHATINAQEYGDILGRGDSRSLTQGQTNQKEYDRYYSLMNKPGAQV